MPRISWFNVFAALLFLWIGRCAAPIPDPDPLVICNDMPDGGWRVRPN